MNDQLDQALRRWHDENRTRAEALRDRALPAPVHPIRRLLMHRATPLAAAVFFLALMLPILFPAQHVRADVMMAPEGGRLDAWAGGHLLGSCELRHTDVAVEISATHARVTLNQTFHNPHDEAIEAVYTFPMSHDAAVDRMTMTVGDRVVVGEVRERAEARAIYEAARAGGRVASLLEQERPNIFTQSIANIMPGAAIDVEISYVEPIDRIGRDFEFSFPTVVSPRYIPGYPKGNETPPLPDRFTLGRGLVLTGPASIEITETAEDSPALGASRLRTMLAASTPIEVPTRDPDDEDSLQLWNAFNATYADGSIESGFICLDGTGHVAGRWFWIDPTFASNPGGTGGAPDTTEVPDASRITPRPERPEMRAGHDIDIRVTIETGGPGITSWESPLHDVDMHRGSVRADGSPTSATFTLRNRREIPNRDFVLRWTQTDASIEHAVLAHHDAEQGGFVAITLDPPARIEDDEAVARELVFVLDTSGSMGGFPIEKSKAVMREMIDAMRERDTFNVITFAGHTSILWERPKPATAHNLKEARAFIESLSGNGGTEMMTAIEAALRATPEAARTVDELERTGGNRLVLNPGDLDLRDGRLFIEDMQILGAQGDPESIEVWDGMLFGMDGTDRLVFANGSWAPKREGGASYGDIVLEGQFMNLSGFRSFGVQSWAYASPAPLRLAIFLTDGQVGNDMAIIDAVRANRKTTRVFSFGIGDSTNRYLLERMAREGGGDVEFVTTEDDADEAVARFTERARTPLLANIEVEVAGVTLRDMTPGSIPDLWDQRPVTILARYDDPGTGTITIRGVTGQGRFERTFALDLPESQPAHDVLKTLWARRTIDDLMTPHLQAVQQGTLGAEVRDRIVDLGVEFSILSQYTSFVAVDRLKVNVEGEPRLVTIPIEMPHRQSFEGTFGPLLPAPVGEDGIDWEASGWRLDAASPTEDVMASLRARYEQRSPVTRELSERERTWAAQIERMESSGAQILGRPGAAPGEASPEDRIDSLVQTDGGVSSQPWMDAGVISTISSGHAHAHLYRVRRSTTRGVYTVTADTGVTLGQPFAPMEDARLGLPMLQMRDAGRYRIDDAPSFGRGAFFVDGDSRTPTAGAAVDQIQAGRFAYGALLDLGDEIVAGSQIVRHLVIDPEVAGLSPANERVVPDEYKDAVRAYFEGIEVKAADELVDEVGDDRGDELADELGGAPTSEITFATTPDAAILGRPAYVQSIELVDRLARLHPLAVVIVLDVHASEGRPKAIAYAAALAHPDHDLVRRAVEAVVGDASDEEARTTLAGLATEARGHLETIRRLTILDQRLADDLRDVEGDEPILVSVLVTDLQTTPESLTVLARDEETMTIVGTTSDAESVALSKGVRRVVRAD